MEPVMEDHAFFFPGHSERQTVPVGSAYQATHIPEARTTSISSQDSTVAQPQLVAQSIAGSGTAAADALSTWLDEVREFRFLYSNECFFRVPLGPFCLLNPSGCLI